MSADLLRRAAAELRARAGRATDGAWLAAHHAPTDEWWVHGQYGATVIASAGESHTVAELDARYIALMHPPVALALATMLDGWAEFQETFPDLPALTDDVLAIACEILREPS